MLIKSIECDAIFMPLKRPTKSSLAVRTGTVRTIVRVESDEGVVGIGETFGGTVTTTLIRKMVNQVVGYPANDFEGLVRRLGQLPYFYGYAGYVALSGIETACWDLYGKTVGLPVSQLLGGTQRDEVAVSAYLFLEASDEAPRSRAARDGDVSHVLGAARDLVDTYGFETLKYKSDGRDDRRDIEVIRALRDEFGPEAPLRIDPNAAWDFERGLRMCQALGSELEYMEDPIGGLDAMARLRQLVDVPFSTNMCVVNFDQLATAVRSNAIDVVLGDQHKWGGLWNSKRLAAVCETFGMGMSWHSGGDLGVSTAATLNFAAANPVVRYAVDAHYPLYVEDIITEPFTIEGGQFAVPEGPGLGVELDEAAVARCAELYQEESRAPSPGGYAYVI